VAMTRRIDRFLIDQHGIDHAAHLDQLLPVPAVAGEPRDLARGNGANLAETDLRHHPLKTGALDAACSGTAKIIIDHLDLGPAKCSEAIAHGVLLRTETDAVILMYRARSGGDAEWKSVEQRVPITWTACHLGGSRPWFRCIAYANGQYCGRRVAKLYL